LHVQGDLERLEFFYNTSDTTVPPVYVYVRTTGPVHIACLPAVCG
jgi:hypothetical protein